MVLQFWSSEVHQRSHWVKIKASAGPHSFLEALGEPVSLPSLASRGCPHSFTQDPLPPSSKGSKVASP